MWRDRLSKKKKTKQKQKQKQIKQIKQNKKTNKNKQTKKQTNSCSHASQSKNDRFTARAVAKISGVTENLIRCNELRPVFGEAEVPNTGVGKSASQKDKSEGCHKQQRKNQRPCAQTAVSVKAKLQRDNVREEKRREEKRERERERERKLLQVACHESKSYLQTMQTASSLAHLRPLKR